MTNIPIVTPPVVIDENGVPVSGALAYFFDAGTTTPATVYADTGATTPHPSPLVADGNGRFPDFYSDGMPLKVEIRTPDEVVIDTIDPVPTVGESGDAASAISFAPTSEIQQTNVQAAIEAVYASAVAGADANGWGLSGDAPLATDIDNVSRASGAWRFSAGSTGTFPGGWSGEAGVLLVLRETSGSGLMLISRTDDDAIWQRRLSGDVWQAWVRLIDSGQDQDVADWEAGTSADLGPVSPAKVHAAIGSYPKLLATVNANSGTEIVITDLPTAHLLFTFQNVTVVGSTSKQLLIALSEDGGTSWSSNISVNEFVRVDDTVGGVIAHFEIIPERGLYWTMGVRGDFNSSGDRFRPWRQAPTDHLSKFQNFNAMRLSWFSGGGTFTTSTTNPDSGKVNIWRMA